MPEGDKSSKTEKATPQKLKKARSEGQVAKSQDLASSLAVVVALIMFALLGIKMSGDVGVYMRYCFGRVSLNETSSSGYFTLITSMIIEFVKIMAPYIASIWLTVFIAQASQVGLQVSFKPMEINFDKLNPVNGSKKLFSWKSVITTSISVVKMTVVGIVAWQLFMNHHLVSLIMKPMDLMNIFKGLAALAWDLTIKIAVIILILSVVEYVYQKWQFAEDQKMSKEDLKEEYKQQEGNPEIKSKVKQKQREASQRGLKADVQESDVIITNPIHLAVAIKYDRMGANAPIVTGKGSRLLAERIKEFARTAEPAVPIVENIPLARALYKDCHVGKEISPELYVAVAEVLAIVYKERGENLI